jgi:hypothetical protein
MMGVKLLLGFSLLIASCTWADDVIDRQAIEQLIAALNSHNTPPSDLFTTDAPDSERIIWLDHEDPMSEVTPPRLVIRSVRFITPEVALVDCTNTQYGSIFMARSIPVLLVIKKDGAQWKIASLRVLGLAESLPGHLIE